MLHRFLQREPEDLLAQTMAAETAIARKNFRQAELYARNVLHRAPSYLRASILLASCLLLQARPKQAIRVLEAVLEHKPRNRTVLEQLAKLHAETGDHEKAIHLTQILLKQGEQPPEQWIVYAHYLRIVGRSAESRRAFRYALSLDPNNGAAWWGLVNYFPEEVSPKDEVAMCEALSDRGKVPEHGGPLLIALSIIAHRRGKSKEAFRLLSAGKRLRLQLQPYDPARLSTEVDQALGTFRRKFYTSRSSWGVPDASPIFIVGMPRSGTTLVERILGRHSAIEGAGELLLVPRLLDGLEPRAHPAGGLPQLLASMSEAEIAELGRWYLDRSRDYRRTTKPFFVDKLNLNWSHLDLVRLILPSARIVDVRRSALDCCWSNYRMLFAEGHAASNDLRHIGRFYRDYVRMMEGIDVASPGRILKINYEDVVEDVEGATRRILKFIGLEFQDACVNFHEAAEAVATPSSEQVRRPLFREGIGSAEPYLRWLGPLIEELGPLAPVNEAHAHSSGN